MDVQRPPSQKLPAGLAGVMNPDDNRDSAYFSSTDASSKHTSAASIGGSGLSPANSGYQSSQADKTPSPVAVNLIPQPLVSPSTSNMSVASMVSPTTPGSMDLRRYDSGPNSATLVGSAEPGSRRESVDSRMNQGFSDMKLASSPYASHNHSTSSIHNTLNPQRHPRSGLDSLAIHRISNGYQPSADRNPEQNAKIGKTAPAITGPATSTIARAAEPTKGQAWAFPEEEIQRIGPTPNGSFYDSRRSSVTDSIASSQYTSESRLPAGQRRLDENLEFNRLSTTSSEFPAVHHHSLQHKQLGDIQDDDDELGGPPGSQPYSRTPELRVSHKLAERKRRTEMKELFENLRDLMPQERGSKASKWEILTKAIAEHHRQSEHIRALQSHCNTAAAEMDMIRRELASIRMENAQLRADLSGNQHGPPTPAGPPTTFSDPFASSRPELPPLRSLSGTIPNGAQGPDSMTGVQYEPARTNGYHRGERF